MGPKKEYNLLPFFKFTIKCFRLKFFNFLFSKSNRSTDLNKFLIVGIGNIGTKYLKTRHNLGFEALDQISNFYESTFEKEKLGEISKFSIKGKRVILLKPNTYVNLLGTGSIKKKLTWIT